MPLLLSHLTLEFSRLASRTKSAGQRKSQEEALLKQPSHPAGRVQLGADARFAIDERGASAT
jgi:hypothetical protein